MFSLLSLTLSLSLSLSLIVLSLSCLFATVRELCDESSLHYTDREIKAVQRKRQVQSRHHEQYAFTADVWENKQKGEEI